MVLLEVKVRRVNQVLVPMVVMGIKVKRVILVLLVEQVHQFLQVVLLFGLVHQMQYLQVGIYVMDQMELQI